MKVSVCMITYNHEKFITQAVESVMMQEADFDYELVIGEDCSTDRTREIVFELQKKYPDKIRLLLPEKNLGMNRNFVQTLEACRGEYVALLEGDDYWIDSHKLQKQIELLDSNSAYVMSFHDVLGFSDDPLQVNWDVVEKRQKKDMSVQDLLGGDCPPTCSVVVRRSSIPRIPHWYYSLHVGDWPLFVLIMLNCPEKHIKYIAESMAAYRVHAGGVWSPTHGLKRTEYMYEVVTSLQTHLPHMYYKYIKRAAIRCWFNFANSYNAINAPGKANRYLHQIRRNKPLYILECLYDKGTGWKQIFKILVIVYVPSAYRLFRTAKLSIAGLPLSRHKS